MKHNTFTIVIAAAVLTTFFAAFTMTASAQDDCTDCYQTALDSCTITEPSQDQQCFDQEYYGCMEVCCQIDCEMAGEGCHFDCEDQWFFCEDTCETECDAQCQGDQGCMDSCMQGCTDICLQEADICHLACEEQISLCVDECMAGGDIDGDGIDDVQDNCMYVANADQEDTDSDTVGNACDNCPDVPNFTQVDTDGDCAGDACDLCPTVYSNEPYHDTDNDGTGDACDTDIDQDGVDNGGDNCLFTSNAGQEDTDGDGVGDACDQTSIQVSAYTTLNLLMDKAPDLSSPTPDWHAQLPTSPVVARQAYAFDISSDTTERVVGWYKPDSCVDNNQRGFVLGDNFDGDPSSDDAVKIEISENGAERTILWGLYDKDTYVGQYDLAGQSRSFWAQRSYSAEDGLWYYSYYPIAVNFADVNSSSAWDYAVVDSRVNIVGRYNDLIGSHGYLYQRYYDPGLVEAYTSIDVPGAGRTYGCGINNNGKIVGYYKDTDDWGITNDYHGFLYDGTQYQTIDVPGAENTRAYRINNSDWISGYYEGVDGRLHGFVYSGTAFTTFDIAGARDTLSFGFNDEGKIVGYYRDAVGVHPFQAGPIPITTCQGDFDIDTSVNIADMEVFIAGFGRSDCSGDCPADFYGDGDVDGSDLAVFATNFGRTDCRPEKRLSDR